MHFKRYLADTPIKVLFITVMSTFMESNEAAKLCRLIVPVSGREMTKMGRGEKQ